MKIVTRHIDPKRGFNDPNAFRIDQSIKKTLKQQEPGKIQYAPASDITMVTPVDVLKGLVQKGMTHGTECPVCGQFVKLYSRTINCTMAKALLLFYKKTEEYGVYYMHLFDAFSDQKDPTVYRGDFAKLRFWGLIAEAPSTKTAGKKTSGKWMLTDKGKNFIHGLIGVPKYVYVYNNKVQSQSPEEITITDALKNPFDYEDIMGTKVDSVLKNLVTVDAGQLCRDGTHAW